MSSFVSGSKKHEQMVLFGDFRITNVIETITELLSLNQAKHKYVTSYVTAKIYVVGYSMAHIIMS